MDSSVQQDLAPYWQSRGFFETDLPLKDAVKSLSDDKPLIEARYQGSSAWGFVDTRTGQETVFSHAGVWAWGSDIQTGNFVPQGERAPYGLPEGQIEKRPSWRCRLSYAFDTSKDKSFYTLLDALEAVICQLSDFNKGNRPRRQPKSTARLRFVMSTKLFVNKRENASKGLPSKVTYPIHPWIRQALEKEKELMPNPVLPHLYEFSGNRLHNLEDCKKTLFSELDVVWTSFKVVFKIGREDWGVNIQPIDFIRVGRIEEEGRDEELFEHATLPLPVRQLQIGVVSVLDGTVLGKRTATEASLGEISISTSPIVVQTEAPTIFDSKPGLDTDQAEDMDVSLDNANQNASHAGSSNAEPLNSQTSTGQTSITESSTAQTSTSKRQSAKRTRVSSRAQPTKPKPLKQKGRGRDK